MHRAAFEFIGRYSTAENIFVIEIGSRNINGSVRCHFPGANYVGLDLSPGPCVDIVRDALDHTPDDLVDLVICCEVLEHAATWRKILKHSAGWLKRGGKMLVTCAAPGREPHSATDGGKLRAGEYYANIAQQEMAAAMTAANLEQIDVSGNTEWKDTYAIGWK